MSDNIKVVVKVRPLISRERDEKLSYQWRIENNTLYQIDQSGRDYGVSYTFDKVYDENTKTSDVFNDVAKPIVEAAIEGINGTIFAYGQTSSGKTYTMTGTSEDPGIIPQAVIQLFDIIKSREDRDFLIRVSYIEIYNEKIKDLLDAKAVPKIQDHHGHPGVKLDATEKVTSSAEEILDIMKEGEMNRQIGSTNMNEQSSRSHSIFQITIESREHTGDVEVGCINVSTLNLVDLAGSERSGQTGATGIRFTEGKHINKSLLSLALVIKQLSDDPNRYINFRDSNLTRILQNSLGGNAKTIIICAVTPAAAEETVSTLQFANRAKAIKNKPIVNAVTNNATMIQKLTKELNQLQSQLEVKKNIEQDNRKLQKKIEALQRQIINGFGRVAPVVRNDRRQTWCAPRRNTIDALHTIQEDEGLAVAVPRFCTPALKYNPAMQSEYQPIAVSNTNLMPRVSEETASGHVTPPPITNKKSVNFTDDIIDLDSDDDSSNSSQCSPYHQCYDSSKTPPCILREKAKKAEKSYNEIIDLTKREKIYPPPIEELMKKLEENTYIITTLEDKVITLNKKCSDRDTEINELQNKITKSEEDLKSVLTQKDEIDTAHRETVIKLTDLECSFETLKNRFTSREKELLALLDEKKCETKIHGQSFSQPLEKSINFMNLSKDISLVQSDTDNSIVNLTDDETLLPIQKLVKELQDKISSKDSMIEELECNLFKEKQNITELKVTNSTIQNSVDALNKKVCEFEIKNSMLMSNIEQLNTIIETQKQSLENKSRDIESYIDSIKKLQMKLVNTQIVSDLDDINLEDMMLKERELIVNNDNLRNIIHSLKNVIDNRNKEIYDLKIDNSNKNLSDIDDKNKEIIRLQNEVEELKEKLHKNDDKLTRLTEQCETLLAIKKSLIIKLEELETENKTLMEQHQEHITKLAQFNTIIEEERCKSYEKHEQSLQLDRLTEINNSLQKEISHKEDILVRLQKENTKLNEYFEALKLVTYKIKNILLNTNDTEKLMTNDYDSLFKYLETSVANFETIVLENNVLKRDYQKSKTDHETELEKLQNDVSMYRAEIQSMKLDFHKKFEQIDSLTKQNESLTSDLNNAQTELQNQIKICEELDKKIHDSDHIYVTLTQDVEEKNNQIVNLNERQSELLFEINELKAYIQVKEESFNNLTTEIEYQNANYLSKFSSDNIIQIFPNKDKQITDLAKILHNSDISISEKYSAIIKHTQIVLESIDEKKDLLKNIYIAVSEVAKVFNVYDKFNNELDNNGYFHITDILDEIRYQKDIAYDKISNEKLLEATNRVCELTQDNQILKNKVATYEQTFIIYLKELDSIQNENKLLHSSIIECNELITSLQQDIIAKSHGTNTVELVTKKMLYEESQNTPELSSTIYSNDNFEGECINVCLSNIKKTPFNQKTEIKKPQTLLNLCLKTLTEALNTSSCDSNSSISTSTDSQVTLRDDSKSTLETEITKIRLENKNLKDNLDFLRLANRKLIEEQSAIRQEVSLLANPALDLQKKIKEHRTKLNTLIATTYAENKALHSQVRVLHHHHSRFLNVCQKDIPPFKNLLTELLNILKTESQLKNYSLPDILDSENNTELTFKNDSTLDADLLMLDTNVTLATLTNSTLVDHDHTCDVTQVYIDTEPRESKEYYHLQPLASELYNESRDINNVNTVNSVSLNVDELAKKSNQNTELVFCEGCKDKRDIQIKTEKLATELSLLLNEKAEIEEKYNNLQLEVPSLDILVRKLQTLESELHLKKTEFTNLTNNYHKANLELKQLQEENITLSTQVMENISEAEALKKELDDLKEKNKLLDKTSDMQHQRYEKNIVNTSLTCSECISKNELINKYLLETRSPNIRSHSDFESSRHNKICSLQSELHASKEDCKKITEEVATIKTQLERSNFSRSIESKFSVLDDCESTIFASKHFDDNHTTQRLEEKPLDLYSLDKIDCLNFYIEKTGSEKENLNQDAKIIDILKMLYNNLVTNHKNEVEILINKLQGLAETNKLLQIEFDIISMKHTKILKELDDKISTIKKNMIAIQNNLNEIPDDEKYSKVIAVFENDILPVLDTEFSVNLRPLFQILINYITIKYKNDINDKMEHNLKLQQKIESVLSELNSVNQNQMEIKKQLSDKEKECNLLKSQNEISQEINKANTLELQDFIAQRYQFLMKCDIIDKLNVDFSLPLNDNVKLIFETLVNKLQNEIQKTHVTENLKLENENIKALLEEKVKEMDQLSLRNKKLQEINGAVTIDLVQKVNEWEKQKLKHADQCKEFEKMLADHISNINDKHNLMQEINNLKETLSKKESLNQELNSDKIQELLKNISSLESNIIDLKSINVKEKAIYSEELCKSNKVIKTKEDIIKKMEADIQALQENEQKHCSILKEEIANLSAKILETEDKYEKKCRDITRLEMNIKTHEKSVQIQSSIVKRLQKQKEEDGKIISDLTDKCSALEAQQMEIKSLRDQIGRLETIKNNLEVRISELEIELKNCQEEKSLEQTKTNIRRYNQSVHDSKRQFDDEKEDSQDRNKMDIMFSSRPKPDDLFTDNNENISHRSTPTNNNIEKRRNSLFDREENDKEDEARPSSVAATRLRRQSIHDFHRSILRHTSSPGDYNKMEVMCTNGSNLDDMFANNDENISKHSSPTKSDCDKRPSSSLGREQNDKEDEARPSSVAATRLRRQSTHDFHRGILTHIPSPGALSTDCTQIGDGPVNYSDYATIKATLNACQQELESLKEKYNELDEECEICAQYLRERDEQCARLKKEKSSLEETVAALRKKIENNSYSTTGVETKPSYASAAVNTDEDWANLHSVVVDRMSFDAEVEKNKKLTKAVEEFRLKNRDLKSTLGKMQNALEKYAAKDGSATAKELQTTKRELESCQQELEELKRKYKEVDEECETCAQYLREREEQCQKLREANSALKDKLEEMKSGKVCTSRKKRQSIHDQHRDSTSHQVDATTETSDDLLSYLVERDHNTRTNNEQPSTDMLRLTMMVEQLSHEKKSLEHQLAQLTAAQLPMYVATGSAIVQNQQLTDILKENQKLKKMNAKLVHFCKKRSKSQSDTDRDVKNTPNQD